MDKIGAQLLDGEFLFAYLDDVYVLCKPHRVRPVYDAIAKAFAFGERLILRVPGRN